MKIWLLLCLIFLIGLPSVTVAQIQAQDLDRVQLAIRYYQQKDYEKAAALYKELYESTLSRTYFERYITCLIGIPDYDKASEEIEKAIRTNENDPDLYVQWAFLLKNQGLEEESNEKLQDALSLVVPSRAEYIQLANSMVSRGEYDFAEKVYQEAMQKLPDENFHYELGRVYLYERDYQKMFDEYMILIRTDESLIVGVQSNILSALRSDVDNSLHEYFRTLLIKKIQEDPDVIVYNRMLVWYFMQVNNFAGALRQEIALDRRTNAEDIPLNELAKIAGRNGDYKDAIDAYNYLIDKGKEQSLYRTAVQGRMQLEYLQFTETKQEERLPEQLNNQFEETLEELGTSAETYSLIIDYAHFLAFYYGQSERALSILNEAMSLRDLTLYQQDLIKTELADVNVYGGDMYEAILLYSQVIENNKTNDLGDQVKLKKAKLGYYMGDLNWAKAQLDVIKASTSKLVANDAMQLSIFIGTNTSSDTTQVPVQQFGRADLLRFRNQQEESWAVLDSIETNYPYNSLIDDIYYRKAGLLASNGDFEQAATYLEKIVTGYAYDLLGDDAMFELADIYENHLNRKEEAAELYKNLLLQFPGSVYASEAREIFRSLETENPINPEDTETNFFDNNL